MATRSIFPGDNAVSESLGYIMIFGVVMACIALIYINGSQVINDAQESTSFQGMGQSFEVVNSDIAKAAYQQSPAMTSRLNVNYGTLSALGPGASGSRIKIYSDYSGGTPIYDMPLGIIRFESVRWGKSICIEDGALIEMYGGNGFYGSGMTYEPRMYYSPNSSTLMISVVNLWLKNPAGAPESILSIGNGIANIRSQWNNTTVLQHDVDWQNHKIINISITTDYPGAWTNYFDVGGFNGPFSVETPGDPDANLVSITCDNTGSNKVKSIIIVTYDVDVSM
jgi:hypothetical protein